MKKTKSNSFSFLPAPLKQLVANLKALKIRVYRKGYFGTRGKALPIASRFLKTLKKTPPDILFFGDSVSLRVANDDQDKRTLGQMIAEALSPKKVQVTSFSAYTSYMYLVFIGLARRMKAKPKWVILPFNLRCLSPQWDACPIWQYTQENAILQALINDPDSTPGPVAPVYLDSRIYYQVAIASPMSPWKTIKDFKDATREKPNGLELERQRQKNILILHYGSPAYEYHRQFGFLCDAIREAQAIGAKTLVYLTPLNLEFIRQIGGEELVEIVRSNCNLVKKAIERVGFSDGVIFQDWADGFTADHFFHREEMTEHLAEKGRLKLTSMINARIKKD